MGLLDLVSCGSEDAHCYWLHGHCFYLAEQLVETHSVESEYGFVRCVQQLFREALHCLGRQLACGDVAAISKPVPPRDKVGPLGRGAAQVDCGVDKRGWLHFVFSRAIWQLVWLGDGHMVN